MAPERTGVIQTAALVSRSPSVAPAQVDPLPSDAAYPPTADLATPCQCCWNRINLNVAPTRRAWGCSRGACCPLTCPRRAAAGPRGTGCRLDIHCRPPRAACTALEEAPATCCALPTLPIGLGDSCSRCTAQVAGGLPPPTAAAAPRAPCLLVPCLPGRPARTAPQPAQPPVRPRAGPAGVRARASVPASALFECGGACKPSWTQRKPCIGRPGPDHPKSPWSPPPADLKVPRSAGLWRACCASRQRRPPYPRARHRAPTLSNSRCRRADRRSTRWRPH